MRALVDARPWRVASLVGLGFVSACLLAIAFLTPTTSEPMTLYATTETLLTLLSFGAASLMRCRFVQTRRCSDLLIAVAVLVFGLVHLTCAIPGALNLRSDGYLGAVDLSGELLACAVVAAAACGPHKPLLLGARRPDALLAGASLSIISLAGGLALALQGQLSGFEMDEGSVASHPLALAFIVASAGLLVSAVVGFTRDGDASEASRSWPFACAAALMAAALLSQLPGPVGPDHGSAADALQMIAVGLIVGAGIRWELQAKRLAARTAAIAERQRVARDLHDGLAQDLAFIAAHGERIAADVGPDHPVVTAARRALQISRCAIAELSDPDAATLHEALASIAAELRVRFDIAIALDVHLADEPPEDVQEHVSRIVREAIANAARHGHAQTVAVWIREEDGHLRLRVQDDGRGIVTATAGQQREGFGLRSIRERAAGLGGSMKVSQVGARGTVLDVMLS